MVDAGVARFKLFMAYKGELMVRDDELAATMERARDLGGADHGPRRERRRGRPARQARAGARATPPRSTTRSRARRSSRPRPPAARRGSPSTRARRCSSSTSPARRRPRRSRPPSSVARDVSGETCTQYLVNTIDDLRRPGVEGCRYICSPPLRDAANHEPLWDYVRRGVLESVSTDHCPFDDEQKSPRARRLQPRAQRPAGDPAPARQALGRGRRRRAHHAEPARRPHEHDDRAPLRPRRQGRDRPWQGRRHRRPRPRRAAALRRRDVAHERRLRPLRGRDGERAACATPTAAARWSTTAARSVTAPGHGRFVAPVACRARRCPHEPEHRRRPASSPTCASCTSATAARDGARRLAWTPDWLAARDWLLAQARRAAGHRRSRRGGQHLGARCPGDGRRRASSSSARTSTRCRPAAGSTARSALLAALGVAARARRRGRAAARRRSGSSTGPTRRARASAAASLGSSAVAGHARSRRRARPARREGTRLQDALAACDVDLDGAGAATARLEGALAYLELHIEQGPVLLDTGRLAVGGQRHVRRRALPGHLHRPGRARRLDADAPAPRRARRRGDRRARDPRGRHPPRRRLHRRRDEGRARASSPRSQAPAR